MENKMFLVSFGSSDSFIADQHELDEARESVEKFLKEKFAGADVDYDFFRYATVKEIKPEDMKDYTGYGHLDPATIDRIKTHIATGVDVMESDKELNSNQAFH